MSKIFSFTNKHQKGWPKNKSQIEKYYRTKCEILFLDFSFSIKLFFFKKTQTQNRIICKFDFNIFFYQKSKFICFEILYIYPKVNLIKEHL